MNAVEMLKADHEKVKGLFRQYENSDEKREKKKIADEILHELQVHAALEEEIFYPAYKRKAEAEGKEMVAEAVEEHHVVHLLIGEIKEMKSVTEQFDAKMKVLIENVEHHVQEEESEMLPAAQETLGEEIEKLTPKMEKRKQELMAAVA